MIGLFYAIFAPRLENNTDEEVRYAFKTVIKVSSLTNGGIPPSVTEQFLFQFLEFLKSLQVLKTAHYILKRCPVKVQHWIGIGRAIINIKNINNPRPYQAIVNSAIMSVMHECPLQNISGASLIHDKWPFTKPHMHNTAIEEGLKLVFCCPGPHLSFAGCVCQRLQNTSGKNDRLSFSQAGAF